MAEPLRTSLNSINPMSSISRFTVTPELYFGYGIIDRIELNVKGWVGTATAGGKLGTTFRVTNIRAPYKVAISPQFSYSANSDTSKPAIGSDYIFPDYELFGYEFPVINSYSFNRAISLYFVSSYTFYHLSISKWVLTDLNHSYNIHRLGLTLGLSLKGKAFFLRPEVSFNYFKGLSSTPYISTTMGLGLGVEMPKH